MSAVLLPAVTGVVAGLGVAMPLGAVGVLVVQEGMTKGVRAGLEAATGVALVDLLYAAVAAVLGTAIAAALGPHSREISVVGGGVLIVIAVRGLVIWRRGGAPESPRQVHGTVRFALLTLINPLTAIYFTILAVSSRGVFGAGAVSVCIFVAAVGVSSWCWQAVLAVGGSVAGRRLSDRHRGWTVLAGYGIVAAYGLRLLF